MRTTYEESHPRHPRHGYIDHFEDGKHVRTTFEESHPSRGHIGHFEDGKHVRTTFEESHPNHGRIGHFEDGKLVRTTFEEFHLFHNEIHHHKDGHLRVTYVTGSDVNAEDRPPAGEGGPKRKRKNGAQRAAKKAAKRAEAEEGGYTDKGRIAFKNEGGALITGGKRTCVPDALGMLLLSLSIEVDMTSLYAIMPTHPDRNTRFTVANTYVEQFGLTLQRVTSRFMKQKGGIAFHLLNASGLFIVQLRITNGKNDNEPDLHCVAYDGLTVRDNCRYSKVKELDATDRTETKAREVFDSLFPGLEVRINNVYELHTL